MAHRLPLSLASTINGFTLVTSDFSSTISSASYHSLLSFRSHSFIPHFFISCFLDIISYIKKFHLIFLLSLLSWYFLSHVFLTFLLHFYVHNFFVHYCFLFNFFCSTCVHHALTLSYSTHLISNYYVLLYMPNHGPLKIFQFKNTL